MARGLRFDQELCLACGSCTLECAVAHSEIGSLEGAVGEVPPPRPRLTLLGSKEAVQALRCEQCDVPFCVMSCRTGALTHDTNENTILFDDSLCVGCWMCVMVCPVGIRPDPARKIAVRCDVCPGEETPACVRACPTSALRVTEKPPRIASTSFDGHVVVIGASPAGVAACEAVRLQAPRASLSLVTDERDLARSRITRSALLFGGGAADKADWRGESDLSDYLPAEAGLGISAAKLLVDKQSVLLADGTELAYDRLILAAAAHAACPDIPGVSLPGVFGIRDLRDAQGIGKTARSAQNAVVFDAGCVGLQIAEALSSLGVSMTVVTPSPHLFFPLVDEVAGRRVESLLTSRGVAVRTGTDMIAIMGERRVERVRLDDGEELPADLVIIRKTIEPQVDWLQGSGLRIGRGITVDTSCRTTVENVFAVGDCTEILDPITGAHFVGGIWPMDHEMGYVAGSMAAGIERSIPVALRMNASTYFSVPIVSLGVAEEGRHPDAESETLVDAEETYRKLALRAWRTIRAALYDDTGVAASFFRGTADELRLMMRLLNS